MFLKERLSSISVLLDGSFHIYNQHASFQLRRMNNKVYYGYRRGGKYIIIFISFTKYFETVTIENT